MNSISPQALGNGASQPCTEISETISQNTSFFPLSFFSQAFVTKTERNLIQVSK
jgi:hypothetical protein